MAEVAQRERYADGQVIINRTAPGKDVFLLLTGAARIQVVTPGGRHVTYDIVEAGETVGELAAIDGGNRSADVVAQAEVELARLPQKAFLALMAQHPAFSFCIARRMARTARWMSEQVQVFQGYSGRGRICVELLRLCGNEAGVSIWITDHDMSTRVGCTRPHVNRIINKLVRDGVLARPEPCTTIVLDVPGLKAVRDDSQLAD